MYNCIFSAHCTEQICDKSCPILAETSYLLERNNIGMQSKVFAADKVEISKYMNLLESEDALSLLVCKDTVKSAELLTYCAICKNWRGNRLHCNVYNLKYSSYLESLKQSWSIKSEIDELEYIKIWIKSAKVLIISNLDFVNFGDFESQTLLNIIQSRNEYGKSTIVVSPPLRDLIKKPNSLFYVRLETVLHNAMKSSKEGKV